MRVTIVAAAIRGATILPSLEEWKDVIALMDYGGTSDTRRHSLIETDLTNCKTGMKQLPAVTKCCKWL